MTFFSVNSGFNRSQCNLSGIVIIGNIAVFIGNTKIAGRPFQLEQCEHGCGGSQISDHPPIFLPERGRDIYKGKNEFREAGQQQRNRSGQ